MTARYEPRSPAAGRVDLASAIPLAAPLTAIVEVVSVCNLRCHFCPTGDVRLARGTGKYRGLLDFDLFRKFVADLDGLAAPLRALHLHKDGEPLLHPRFCDMVCEARKSGRVEKIETVTNGVLLGPEMNRRLVDSGLTRIKISVYGLSSDGFKRASGVAVDFARYVDNVADLYARRGNVEVYVKAMEEGLTDEEKRMFLATFGEISDTIFLEHCGDTWPDFHVGGDTAAPGLGIMGQATRAYKKVCPQPFFNFTVCADGRVTACCADWQVRLVVGDLRRASVSEIWSSEEFRAFRAMMLGGGRKDHPLCGGCGYPTFACIDDVDDAAPRLLEKMEAVA